MYECCVFQVINKSMEPPKPEVTPNATPGLMGTMSGMGLAGRTSAAAMLPQQRMISGQKKDCIRLRGLPYEAQVQHILDFLGDYAKHIVFQGVHMVYNAQVCFHNVLLCVTPQIDNNVLFRVIRAVRLSSRWTEKRRRWRRPLRDTTSTCR